VSIISSPISSGLLDSSQYFIHEIMLPTNRLVICPSDPFETDCSTETNCGGQTKPQSDSFIQSPPHWKKQDREQHNAHKRMSLKTNGHWGGHASRFGEGAYAAKEALSRMSSCRKRVYSVCEVIPCAYDTIFD
jgi:hypothetical protein